MARRDVNPACKLDLPELAFDGGSFGGLGVVRIQTLTDERTKESRRAILKLDEEHKATLWNQLVLPDGHLRDMSM